MRRFVASLALAGIAILASAAGCELIVPKDLPAFTCAPGAANACFSGQVCSPAGVCVASCPQTACGADLVCDTISHLCVPKVDVPEAGENDAGDLDSTLPPDAPTDSPPPFEGGSDTGCTRDLGCNCLTNASCNADLFCGSDSVLGDAVKGTGPLCTKPCCKSEDCPADFVCYGPGTGGTYCVRPGLLPRGSANGASKGGAACTTAESCRSGVCNGSISKVCTDTCCSDSDCTAPAICRRISVENHNVFACAVPPAGTLGNDSACSVSADCNSGMCVGSGFGQCKPHGCGKATCLAQRPPSSGFGTCSYLQTSGAPEYLGACLHNAENPDGPPGTGDVGTTCTSGSDCKTAFCDPIAKKCTDVCCVDTDCANYPGTKCRPSTNPHYLTCQ
jgi:hypothetical protein